MKLDPEVLFLIPNRHQIQRTLRPRKLQKQKNFKMVATSSARHYEKLNFSFTECHKDQPSKFPASDTRYGSDFWRHDICLHNAAIGISLSHFGGFGRKALRYRNPCQRSRPHLPLPFHPATFSFFGLLAPARRGQLFGPPQPCPGWGMTKPASSRTKPSKEKRGQTRHIEECAAQPSAVQKKPLDRGTGGILEGGAPTPCSNGGPKATDPDPLQGLSVRELRLQSETRERRLPK
ncbi:hypothetical protein LSM04_003654 [Trypanosoma melophagium]|uniref:uncharacterized protein n=1 Tax=Trypanosoma melophagium TaxID=715481 RepID=UPI00351A9824|nr:hypothetical protein LSM04_003654 [Trypanosoma melophagium]